LITSGQAKSAEDAARQVADKAKKLGTIESVVERLRKAYGRKYPQHRRR